MVMKKIPENFFVVFYTFSFFNIVKNAKKKIILMFAKLINSLTFHIIRLVNYGEYRITERFFAFHIFLNSY